MPARVLVIGIDAAESTLIERWSSQGRLPTFARLAATGAVRRLANPLDTIPGAIWPEITSGRPGAEIGHFCTVNQIRAGETGYRPFAENELDPAADYWSIAAAAGCRVAAIDQVQCGVNAKLNGIQVSEWGCHDRNFRTMTHPPELLDEIDTRHGPYPVGSCDSYPKTHEGYTKLLMDLLEGCDRKSALLLDLLGREDWDLFTCTFGESHCAGHQLWHLHDTRHTQHDPRAPQVLKDAIRSVYARIDEGMAKLLEANGDRGVTVVFASHGMGPYIGGYQLIPELLVRLGLSSDRGTASHSLVRKVQNKVKDRVPMTMVPFLEKLAKRSGFLRRAQSRFGGMVFPLDSPRTRAVFVPNNRVGGIRLNIKGREPYGCLEPGAEVAALVDELRRELHALRHVDTGRPVVERVTTADEAFGPDHHPGIPDVMVRFRSDSGPIEACRSERVGTIRVPTQNVRFARSGDHTPESRLWTVGPTEPAGARLADAHVLDLAPTVLDLLGVPIPSQMHGSALCAKRG